jgi:hypothetical protein
MLAARIAIIATLATAQIAHAQVDLENMPDPPTTELQRLKPFLGTYTLTSDYFGRQWSGTLDVRPAVNGWYVEWEINIHGGPIERQLRMLATFDSSVKHFRIWRFETLPPEPSDRAEGKGRLEGGEFIQEWRMPAPDGHPGTFRNRIRMQGPDTLVIISEGIRDGESGVTRIGVTTAVRRM